MGAAYPNSAMADGGDTWEPVPSAGKPQATCLAAPGDGWVSVGATVAHTPDGGRTWMAAYTPALPAQPTVATGILACGPGWAWVAYTGETLPGTAPELVVATGDRGRAWRAVLGRGLYDPAGTVPTLAQAFLNAFVARSARTAFALTVCGPCSAPPEVMATTDGGRTWRTAPIPGARGVAAASFPDALHGFVTTVAVTSGGPVFGTADGGRTWRQVYPPAAPPGSRA